jgi:hypothetical protein
LRTFAHPWNLRSWSQLHVPATLIRPSVAISLSLWKRGQGAPDAQRTRGSHADKERRRSAAADRHSPRNGLRPIARSPRCSGLFGHRRLSNTSTGLIPASGDQDHTPWPSASAALRPRAAAASITSRATCRDDRDTPSDEVRDGGNLTSDCVSEKENYFHCRPLTRRANH